MIDENEAEAKAARIAEAKNRLKILEITLAAQARFMIYPDLAPRIINLALIEVGPHERVIGIDAQLDDLQEKRPELFRPAPSSPAPPARPSSPTARRGDAIKNPGILKRFQTGKM